MKRVISAVVVLIGFAAPAWAGFDEDVAAYKRGDDATALREFRVLAEQGDAGPSTTSASCTTPARACRRTTPRP